MVRSDVGLDVVVAVVSLVLEVAEVAPVAEVAEVIPVAEFAPVAFFRYFILQSNVRWLDPPVA